MTAIERRFRAFDGVEIAFTDHPGPPGSHLPALVCLPGLTRNAKDFADLARRHAPHRRVILPDYRGRGRSARAPSAAAYGPTQHIEDARHLLAVAGIERAVLIGTSFGGLLAMAVTVAVPNIIAGVVMNDIGPTFGGDGVANIRAFVVAPPRPADWDEATTILRRRFPGMPARDDAGWRKIAEGTWAAGADGRLEPAWDPAIVTLMDAGADAPDPWVLFAGLAQVPLLVLRGALSDVLMPETVAAMAERHPRLTHVEVADVGHTPALDEPDAEPALDDFLDQFTD
jgi:pimeloyl-ACP methyl ester carboxylesterase